MTFPEEYMRHPVIGRIHDKALDLPDLAIQSMDMLVTGHLGLTQRNRVGDDERRPVAEEIGRAHV